MPQHFRRLFLSWDLETQSKAKIRVLWRKCKKWDGLPTHEGFGTEAGAGSDEAAEVADPGHGGRRRDLLRSCHCHLVAFAVAGAAVHCPISSFRLRLIVLSFRSLLRLVDFKASVWGGKTLTLTLEDASFPRFSFQSCGKLGEEMADLDDLDRDRREGERETHTHREYSASR